MIAVLKCTRRKCGRMREEYFPSYDRLMQELLDGRVLCHRCSNEMENVQAAPNIRRGGEIAGYEKKNKGKLTIGKAIDSYKSKWV